MLAPIPFIMGHDQVRQHVISRKDITIIDDYVEDGILYLAMSADLDQAQCYMTLPDQTQQLPLSYDAGTRTIAFAYTNLNVSIYVIDENGHSATIIISPK